MPGTQTTGSPDIALLDSKIVANLCVGKFFIDLSPSVYIGNGKYYVLGANVQIKNPLGVIVKPYGDNYEIAPALSGGMDASVSFDVPTQASNYQYGNYEVDVKLFDSVGNSWVVSKVFGLCEPDAQNKTRNYGTLSAKLTGVCKDGKLFVIVNSVPTYKGKNVESQDNDLTLEYPTGSGLDPLPSSVTNFTVQLFEGIYKLTGTVCAVYNLGDNVFVQVLYKIKLEKNQKCLIDECCVQAAFAGLVAGLGTECTQVERDRTTSIIIESLLYIKNAELAANCGADPSDSISALEDLLGCVCTCACNEGTPIIDLTPSRDVAIVGCNVTKTSVGLTDTYTINNYEYKVTVAENGGAVIIAAATQDGCVMTQEVIFNIDVVYNQIKALSLVDFNFWASVIKKALAGLDASCLGLTPAQYALLTLKEFFAAILAKMCSCCGCGAILTNVTVKQDGFNIVFEWDENSSVSSVDVYLDGILLGTVLSGVFIFTGPIPQESDRVRVWRLIPKCENGSAGTQVEGTFQNVNRVFIVPPEVYSNHLQGTCPYNLQTNLLPLPLGVTAEWHIANNTNPSSLLADPTQAIQGVYYVFAKDNNNFYSTGVQITLVCSASGSCTAPQNLTVVPSYGGNLIQFQSAAFAPPANSYTVKRRLKSASDIPGNYTTIGTPSFNAGASRWVINDNTSVPNVLYVYRAISNCGGTAPYIDFEYANIVCPTLELTPKVTEIDYSFIGAGGEIDKYEITAYKDDQVTPIHTDTFTPAFPNPIVGSMVYLDHSAVHYLRIRAFIGSYYKDCVFVETKTLSDTSTLTIDYIAGAWLASLSSALPTNLVMNGAQAKGSTSSICSGTLQSDVMPSMTIPAYELGVSDQTDGLNYLSTYYSIDNGVNITGHGTPVNGGSFVHDGVTVTVVINHLSCGSYPA